MKLNVQSDIVVRWSAHTAASQPERHGFDLEALSLSVWRSPWVTMVSVIPLSPKTNTVD